MKTPPTTSAAFDSWATQWEDDVAFIAECDELVATYHQEYGPPLPLPAEKDPKVQTTDQPKKKRRRAPSVLSMLHADDHMPSVCDTASTPPGSRPKQPPEPPRKVRSASSAAAIGPPAVVPSLASLSFRQRWIDPPDTSLPSIPVESAAPSNPFKRWVESSWGGVGAVAPRPPDIAAPPSQAQLKQHQASGNR